MLSASAATHQHTIVTSTTPITSTIDHITPPTADRTTRIIASTTNMSPVITDDANVHAANKTIPMTAALDNNNNASIATNQDDRVAPPTSTHPNNDRSLRLSPSAPPCGIASTTHDHSMTIPGTTCNNNKVAFNLLSNEQPIATTIRQSCISADSNHDSGIVTTAQSLCTTSPHRHQRASRSPSRVLLLLGERGASQRDKQPIKDNHNDPTSSSFPHDIMSFLLSTTDQNVTTACPRTKGSHTSLSPCAQQPSSVSSSIVEGITGRIDGDVVASTDTIATDTTSLPAIANHGGDTHKDQGDREHDHRNARDHTDNHPMQVVQDATKSRILIQSSLSPVQASSSSFSIPSSNISSIAMPTLTRNPMLPSTPAPLIPPSSSSNSSSSSNNSVDNGHGTIRGAHGSFTPVPSSLSNTVSLSQPIPESRGGQRTIATNNGVSSSSHPPRLRHQNIIPPGPTAVLYPSRTNPTLSKPPPNSTLSSSNPTSSSVATTTVAAFPGSSSGTVINGINPSTATIRPPSASLHGHSSMQSQALQNPALHTRTRPPVSTFSDQQASNKSVIVKYGGDYNRGGNHTNVSLPQQQSLASPHHPMSLSQQSLPTRPNPGTSVPIPLHQPHHRITHDTNLATSSLPQSRQSPPPPASLSHPVQSSLFLSPVNNRLSSCNPSSSQSTHAPPVRPSSHASTFPLPPSNAGATIAPPMSQFITHHRHVPAVSVTSTHGQQHPSPMNGTSSISVTKPPGHIHLQQHPTMAHPNHATTTQHNSPVPPSHWAASISNGNIAVPDTITNTNNTTEKMTSPPNSTIPVDGRLDDAIYHHTATPTAVPTDSLQSGTNVGSKSTATSAIPIRGTTVPIHHTPKDAPPRRSHVPPSHPVHHDTFLSESANRIHDGANVVHNNGGHGTNRNGHNNRDHDATKTIHRHEMTGNNQGNTDDTNTALSGDVVISISRPSSSSQQTTIPEDTERNNSAIVSMVHEGAEDEEETIERCLHQLSQQIGQLEDHVKHLQEALQACHSCPDMFNDQDIQALHVALHEAYNKYLEKIHDFNYTYETYQDSVVRFKKMLDTRMQILEQLNERTHIFERDPKLLAYFARRHAELEEYWRSIKQQLINNSSSIKQ